MIEYYAARAKEYDRVYLKPERQTDLRSIEKWVATKFQNEGVLEIACGTGYWTQFIAPVATHVLAIDGALETIRIAESRVPSSKVEFVVGDAYALPELAADFSSAFAGFWFSHIPKARVCEFLKGLNFALGPGAKVVFIDNLFVEGNSTPLSDRDVDGNTYQWRQLGDGSTYKVVKNFPTQEELRSDLAGIGQDVTYREWTYFWSLEYLTDLPNF